VFLHYLAKHKRPKLAKFCFTVYGVKLNVKISNFHMNAHTETYVPLITCITDDTDAENAAAGLPSYDVDELK